MKKLTLFSLLLFLASMFNACEDDEVASLIGKWLFGSSTYEVYLDDVLEDSGTFTDMEFQHLEFFKGGTGTVWFDAVEYESFTWEKDGKTVTIDEGTINEMIFKIKKLTKTTLQFTTTEEEEDGEDVYEIIITLNMTKVEE